MKLFVGNLHLETTEFELTHMFSNIEGLLSVNLIKEQDSIHSMQIAFIEFDSKSTGRAAISRFDGHTLKGRSIRVSQAREKLRRDTFN